jgi:hypothetical protein
MIPRLVAVVLIIASAPTHAQLACAQKEYAQYKDRAGSASGQIALAMDYCDDYRRMQLAGVRASAASDSGDHGAADAALSEMHRCADELSKISDALSAAKAKDALQQYARTGCVGAPP